MLRARSFAAAIAAIATVVVLSSTGGCGSKNGDLGGSGDDAGGSGGAGGGDDSTGGSSGGSTFGTPGGADASASSCANGALDCLVPANCTTSISGTVYDPAGVNPLYNVVVYVPNDASGTLSPIKTGTNTCNTCDVSIGNYISATTTDANGKFTLTGVPATTHVPLVVQIGKWRREVFLPSVKACADNPLAGSSMTRLPAKQSEGDIPQMAIVTGGADQLGCFLQGIGLSTTEYTGPTGKGRLHVYQGLPASQNILNLVTIGGAPQLTGGGQGDCTSDNTGCVWNSKANLEKYDIVLLACEGDTFDPDDSDFQGGGNGNGGGATNKTATSKQALHDWLDEGGKVFATHFHYTWFKNSPSADFRGVANWLGTSNGGDTGLYSIDTSIPKGAMLSQWLGNVKQLNGTQISLNGVAESVGTVNAGAQRWIYNPQGDVQRGTGKNGSGGPTNDTKYMSILTPVGGVPIKAVDAGESSGPQYCGKAVFSDLHAGGGANGDIPGSCPKTTLTPQLAALEFLFFDLSACVSSDSVLPVVPPPTK
jgi:hypothetical protein